MICGRYLTHRYGVEDGICLDCGQVNLEAVLLPCPFCGSEQVTVSTCQNITDDERPEISWCVICKACAARVDAMMESGAIAAWNRRAAIPADVEAAARAMQKVRDVIGATEAQRIAFAYAEAAMREALSAIPAQPKNEPSIFDLLEPLSAKLIENGGPDIRGYFARGTGGVDIDDLVTLLAKNEPSEALLRDMEMVRQGVMVAMVASCTCDTKIHEPQHHDDSCRYKVLWFVADKLEDAYRALSEAKLPTKNELLREAHWQKWPQGDAGDAIDWALGHTKETRFFLEDWRSDRAKDWPEYMKWLNFQRDCARRSHTEGQDHEC